MSLWALIAALAGFVWAGDTPVKTVEIHPLLLGGPAEAGSPLAVKLDDHAVVLSAVQSGTMSPEAAARTIIPLFQGSPVDRAAAGVLTQQLLDAAPTAPRDAPQDPTIANLVRSAQSDALAGRYLDGSHPSAELDGMTMTVNGPELEGRRLENLGAGGYGIVDAHPRVPGAVIKSPFQLPHMSAEENARVDEGTSRVLARAGVGPRVLAASRQTGSPMLVKERVYGETVHDLIQSGRYGAEEHALVLEMLDALARARLKSDDMREPNIMIGRTLLDPRRRAYFIDGGNLSSTPAAVPLPAAKSLLYGQPTILDWWDHDGTRYYVTRPFRHVMETGLVKSGKASRWLELKVKLLERYYSLFDPKKPEAL